MPNPFIFAPLDFAFLGMGTDSNPYDVSNGLSDSITTIDTEPVPPIKMSSSNGSIMDRIAQTLAGDRYYGVSPEDKDRALSEALMAMGGRLGAAAGAGSWSKAQPYLSQLLSTGYGTFNQSMDESEKHRMAIQDRVDQLKLRELNMKKAEYEAGSLERDEAAKLALRESAAKNAADWQTTFDSVINDTDILDVDRKMFKQNFNFALQDYLSRPDDPNAINRVLDYVNKVGEAAGQTEKIDQNVGQKLFEKWKTEAPGVPIEQYIDDQKKSYGLKLKTEQESYALLQAKTVETLAGANQNNAYAEYLRAGKQGSGSYGGVSPTNIWNDAKTDLENIGKDDNLLWMMQEIAKDPSKARTFESENPLEFSRIKWVYGGEITPASAQLAYQLVTDPTVRSQVASGVTKKNPTIDLSGARENPNRAPVAKVAYNAKDNLRIQALMNGSKKKLSREEAMQIYDKLSDDEKMRVDNYIKMNLAG